MRKHRRAPDQRRTSEVQHGCTEVIYFFFGAQLATPRVSGSSPS